MTAPYKLTILFDNYLGRPGFKPLWGFAALIQTPDRTLLFDTGSNGRVLLAHMARLGIAPASIDLLFLSHPHWDQIVAHVKHQIGKAVDWAIGGFHLMYADSDGIQRTIRALQALGVHTVVPTHCTGDEAIAAFGRAFGARCIAGGVGTEIVIGDG